MLTTKQRNAINLLLEDLHTVHTDIRVEAKKQGCEKELDEYKEEILNYLIKKVLINTEIPN